MLHRARGGSLAAFLAALALVACTPGSPSPAAMTPSTGGSPPPTPASPGTEPLIVYSGRSESLVATLLERFTGQTAVEVEVRYGDTAELAALILEEGDRSPADVFFAQDAGALGAVTDAGFLLPLPDRVLSRVDAAYRDGEGHWVGASGRARVAAYSTERVTAGELPSSILGFTDASWRGRLGWAPTNGSFQAFVTALRVLEGEEGARAWLEGIIANEPTVFDSNTPAVEAIAAGEIDVAFVNHYYLLTLIAEHGDDYPVANHFFAQGDPGSLVNVAGVGVVATTDHPGAERLVDYLLTEPAQAYFSTETFEYPLTADAEADPRLPPIADVGVPAIDLNQLADLQGTVDLLREVGAID